MIKTVTLDIINEKALLLLHNLEDLNLVKLHQVEESNADASWFQSFKGSITKQTPEQIEQQFQSLRNEWK